MTRINERGTLYSLIYGEVSSISINPVEKNPSFIFILVQNGFFLEVWAVTSDVPAARIGI